MGHAKTTVSPLGVIFFIRVIGLVMINLRSKFEVHTFSSYDNTNGNAKCIK